MVSRLSSLTRQSGLSIVVFHSGFCDTAGSGVFNVMRWRPQPNRLLFNEICSEQCRIVFVQPDPYQ
jgi:hypothetical protein